MSSPYDPWVGRYVTCVKPYEYKDTPRLTCYDPYKVLAANFGMIKVQADDGADMWSLVTYFHFPYFKDGDEVVVVNRDVKLRDDTPPLGLVGTVEEFLSSDQYPNQRRLRLGGSSVNYYAIMDFRHLPRNLYDSLVASGHKLEAAPGVKIVTACADCGGTGLYRGLTVVEPCRTCRPKI